MKNLVRRSDSLTGMYSISQPFLFANQILQAFKSRLVLNLLLHLDLQKPLSFVFSWSFDGLSRTCIYQSLLDCHIHIFFSSLLLFGLLFSVFSAETSQMNWYFCLQLSHGEKSKRENDLEACLQREKYRTRTILILANLIQFLKLEVFSLCETLSHNIHDLKA